MSSIYAKFGKRALDIFVAGTTLAWSWPVLIAVAGAVRLKLGSPILFTQERPGLYGREFTIFKFRTMTDARDEDGNLLPDAERLPAFGRFLRSTSLDELPEFLNVLRGDMSLVGPRPLLMQYLSRYSKRQARRHEVRPGLTGLAQVSGRNALEWPDRLELDVQYVERISLALDLSILARTVVQTVLRRGINQPGEATMQEFRGEQ